MSENSNIKRRIMKEWREAFPFLKPYGTISLMFRTDLFLIGLSCRSSWCSPSYIPEFLVKPLWNIPWPGSDYITAAVGRPVRDNPSYRHQAWTDYEFHDRFFKERVRQTKEYFGEALSGRVTYKILYEEALIEYRYWALKRCASIFFIEYMFALSLYFEDEELWYKINKAYNHYYRLWERRLMKGKFVSILNDLSELEKWRDKVSTVFSSRETMLAECNENLSLKKIRVLNEGELIDIPPEIKDGFSNRLKIAFNNIFHPNLLEW